MENMEFHPKSEFFGGYHYLNRMDKLLITFNHSSIINDLPTMYDSLRAFFEELSAYMNDEEVKENKDKDKEIINILDAAIKEKQENINQNSKRYTQPWEKATINYKEFLKCKGMLRDWRIDLQRQQKKYGLLMRDAEDPATATMRGLMD